MRAVLALPWTSAVAITISFTYTRSGPNLRHRARNGAFVTPAIGASTTGAAGTKSPSRRSMADQATSRSGRFRRAYSSTRRRRLG